MSTDRIKSRREAKKLAYVEILDFIDYITSNPTENDDGTPRSLHDRVLLRQAYAEIYDELLNRAM